MEITVLYFKLCVHKSGFTVANICLPSDNLYMMMTYITHLITDVCVKGVLAIVKLMGK